MVKRRYSPKNIIARTGLGAKIISLSANEFLTVDEIVDRIFRETNVKISVCQVTCFLRKHNTMVFTRTPKVVNHEPS